MQIYLQLAKIEQHIKVNNQFYNMSTEDMNVDSKNAMEGKKMKLLKNKVSND